MLPQTPRWTAAMLRRDLSDRARLHAHTHSLMHELSEGHAPSVIFASEHGANQTRHGNFHPAVYPRICASSDWARRLDKVHTASRRSRARKDWQWMELDSSHSSDALLMNIFCHPGVFDGKALLPAVATLLNIAPASQPCFGARPGVPLRSGLLDRTEVDLTLGDLFVEAKLTESDFQTAAPSLIARYRDLETVFDLARLPRRLPTRAPAPPMPAEDEDFLNLPRKPATPRIQGYQLIRNVLAAYASNASFCVLCDARRHDLIEIWFAVLSAVHAPGFSWRLKLLTWQELASALPQDLQQFLDTKYGIHPA